MKKNIYVPFVRKITYSSDVLIERVLPAEGQLGVAVGDDVEPSQKIGSCKISYDVVDLGKDFKPKDKQTVDYAKGAFVGKSGGKKFEAPYNGYLTTENGKYVFKSEARDYWLLPGVWGKVTDISHNRSVLIKTQLVNIHIPVTTSDFRAGELIVFPNPSDIVSDSYFKNYLKSTFGKIVYVGNNLTMDMIAKAHELKVEAILAGSASIDVYEFAVAKGISLGLFSGYGDTPCPDFIYTFINEINNRYVFFAGEKNLLQVPVSPDNEYKNIIPVKSVLKYVKKGVRVKIFDYEHMGKFGIVDRVSKSSIFVTLPENSEVVEVKTPNLLAIE